MAFDFIGTIEQFGGYQDTIFNNVVYTSFLLALVTVLVTFLIMYSYMPDAFPIYMKWFIYLGISYSIILAMHYNSVRSSLEEQYKSGAYEEIVSTTVTTPSDIITAGT